MKLLEDKFNLEYLITSYDDAHFIRPN